MRQAAPRRPNIRSNDTFYNEVFCRLRTDNYPKYVISGDIPDFSRNGIKHLNIIKFLLDK